MQVSDITFSPGTWGGSSMVMANSVIFGGGISITGALGNSIGIQSAYIDASGSGTIAHGISLSPSYSQSGTAGSADIFVNRTETVLGSGAHRFIDFQVAGVSKFSVGNDGKVRGGGGALTLFDSVVASAGISITGALGNSNYLQAGAVTSQASALGFFGATPAVKPTVTGSKGANAALTSLLSALAALGLLTDSST